MKRIEFAGLVAVGLTAASFGLAACQERPNANTQSVPSAAASGQGTPDNSKRLSLPFPIVPEMAILNGIFRSSRIR